MYNDIKTFEDACAILGHDPLKLPDFSMLPEKQQKGLLAHTKLVLIAQAMNGDWIPDWNNEDEEKYYPWWDMEKDENNPAGFQLSVVGYSYSTSDVGSRLCFKNRELAEYAAEQFFDLYKDYMLVV